MNTCDATWRKMKRSWGTATEFGYEPCGAPASHTRTVKAAHGDYGITSNYCPDHAREDDAPIVAPEPEPAERMEIEPRGTVHATDGTCKLWYRVINGKVFHFALYTPSDYWETGARCRVYSHPYGNLFDQTVVHRDMHVTAYEK